MKRNKQGMTLIEVIVSLLILSTASLIMVTGFVTAMNVFNSSNKYKNIVNDEESVLNGEKRVATDVYVEKEKAKYSIVVNENDTPIEVSGTYRKATTEDNEAILSVFEKKDDDTKKARIVYKNYCKMMTELRAFLKQNKVYGTSYLDGHACKSAIVKWVKEKTGKTVQEFNIVENTQKLYNLVYSESELETIPEIVKKTNVSYDEGKDTYVTICVYPTDDAIRNMTVGEFFDNNYYLNNVYILLGSRVVDGIDNRPSGIWAMYDISSLKNSTDTWLIPKQFVDKSSIIGKTYEEFYSTLNKSEWVSYTTEKK